VRPSEVRKQTKAKFLTRSLYCVLSALSINVLGTPDKHMKRSLSPTLCFYLTCPLFQLLFAFGQVTKTETFSNAAAGFLQNRCLSCHPTDCNKAPKETL